MNFLEMIGKQYGFLTGIGLAEKRGAIQFMLCLCVCGKEHKASIYHLRSGKIKSCGCQKQKMIGAANTKHGFAPLYGKRKRGYGNWKAMVRRCSAPKDTHYAHYGGRGVSVCDRWLGESGFQNFISDMGVPVNGMSIDRIDNNGNYEPGNCRWATRQQQAENQRTNWRISISGEQMTAAEATRRLAIPDVKLYKFLYSSGASKSVCVPIDGWISRNISRP